MIMFLSMHPLTYCDNFCIVEVSGELLDADRETPTRFSIAVSSSNHLITCVDHLRDGCVHYREGGK